MLTARQMAPWNSTKTSYHEADMFRPIVFVFLSRTRVLTVVY